MSYNFELVYSIKLVLKLSNNWFAVLAQLPSGSSIAVCCSLFFSLWPLYRLCVFRCYGLTARCDQLQLLQVGDWLLLLSRPCHGKRLQLVVVHNSERLVAICHARRVLVLRIFVVLHSPILLEMQPHRGLFQVTFLATVAVTCMVECVLWVLHPGLGFSSVDGACSELAFLRCKHKVWVYEDWWKCLEPLYEGRVTGKCSPVIFQQPSHNSTHFSQHYCSATVPAWNEASSCMFKQASASA